MSAMPQQCSLSVWYDRGDFLVLARSVVKCLPLQALRQASDASDVMFSLELSQNVHSKDSLSRHPSETSELLQGAASTDVADIQRLLRLGRPQNDFESQVHGVVERDAGLSTKLPGL